MNKTRFGDDLSIYYDTPVTFAEGEAYPIIELGSFTYTPVIVQWNTRTNQASKFRTGRAKIRSRFDHWITVPGRWVCPGGHVKTYEELKHHAIRNRVSLVHTFQIPNTTKEGDDAES